MRSGETEDSHWLGANPPRDLPPVTEPAGSAIDRRLRADAAEALVGIDAGKQDHVLVVRPKGKQDSKPLRFPVSAQGFASAREYIHRVTSDAPPHSVLIGIEFAGIYGYTLARYLSDSGYPVVSVLPRSTKSLGPAVHGSRLKTDASDAVTIVSALSIGYFAEYPFLLPEYAELRQLASGIQRLTLLRTGSVNRLRSILQTVWPEYEQAFGSFTTVATPLAILEKYPGPSSFMSVSPARMRQFIEHVSHQPLYAEKVYHELSKSARETIGVRHAERVLATQIHQLCAMIKFLDTQRVELETMMASLLEQMPDGRGLLSVPGVGAKGAGLFLGAIGDARAYHSVAQVLKMAGLNLVTAESGMKKGRVHVSKHGRAEIRHMAYLTALRLIQRGRPFFDEYQGLLRRSNGKFKKRALVAVSRSVVRLLFAIARDQRPYTSSPPSGTRRGAQATEQAG